MHFDITTTATPRPEIHDRCYSSFVRRLRGVDWGACRHFVNIDPFPHDVVPREQQETAILESIEVSKRYFGHTISNVATEGNYSEAYNWVWSNAESEIILNLEDDWELKDKIWIDDLMMLMHSTTNMLQVILRAYNYEYAQHITSPCLMHRNLYKAIGGKLMRTINPETQIHAQSHAKRFGLKYPYKVPGKSKPWLDYLAVWPDRVVLKDIGREWMDRQGFCRPQQQGGKKCYFTAWEKKRK